MNPIAYIPIVSTIISVYFLIEILAHLKQKPNTIYLRWWTLGVFCYGLGTAIESTHTFLGWSPFIFKSWYIAGAFLGGVPLAQGTVHLLMNQPFARKSSQLLSIVLTISAVLVILSPLDATLVTHKLNGNVLEWTFIRLITPFINIYALLFLVGGAIYSAYKYSQKTEFKSRFWGNLCIAIGGLLPGIGGTATKFGETYVLYVTELIGIIFIYLGYKIIKSDRSISLYESQIKSKALGNS